MLALVPFVLLGPGGVAYSLYSQVTRRVEIESLPASALLLADRLGVYGAHTILGNLNSIDLAGVVPTVAGVLSSCVAVAALVASAVLYRLGEATVSRFVLAFAAALVGYVAFGKVLSAQYLVWLLPVVPLVRGWVGHGAAVILAATMWLTKLQYGHLNALSEGTGLALVVTRNILLVCLFGLLAGALWPRPSERLRATDRAVE